MNAQKEYRDILYICLIFDRLSVKQFIPELLFTVAVVAFDTFVVVVIQEGYLVVDVLESFVVVVNFVAGLEVVVVAIVEVVMIGATALFILCYKELYSSSYLLKSNLLDIK